MIRADHCFVRTVIRSTTCLDDSPVPERMGQGSLHCFQKFDALLALSCRMDTQAPSFVVCPKADTKAGRLA